jgi:release factor glutamine methyltransferase
MAPVYKPAEDSLLLLRHVKALVQGAVLDMGTGSGIQAIAAAQKPEVSRVLAVDIDPEAVQSAKQNAEEAEVSHKTSIVLGELFMGVGHERFDWIIFNPPYLPSEGAADEVSWVGGARGCEIIERFLSEAPDHLEPNGAILMVYSTLTGLELDRFSGVFTIEVLEETDLFFEKLSCVLLRLR